MPISYKTLFLLEADDFSLLEIKALDVQSDDPNKVYFWFRFDKATRHLERLEFVSMAEDGADQQREFRQGQLRFNDRRGSYTAVSTPTPVEVAVRAATPLASELDEAIQHYFIGA